ncbi:hypothetical protein [Leclercia sp.]|uniref:hypothetical protein n=1 Tax=Leclercia sp. TaxID=1898428 RepID=UPI0028BE073D|nr:hypothetical protein [Leclercia sp.]
MITELIKIGQNTYAVCVGKITYQPGRQYPWLGQHGGISQYFSTEREATHFAATGKTEAE